MTVTIKRNCSSSIRHSEDIISFGDFTIRISGEAFEKFMKIFNVPGKPLPTTILQWSILDGLDTICKRIDEVGDLQ